MAPKILNYDRLMKIVNYQNKKIKDLMLKFPHLSVNINSLNFIYYKLLIIISIKINR